MLARVGAFLWGELHICIPIKEAHQVKPIYGHHPCIQQLSKSNIQS